MTALADPGTLVRFTAGPWSGALAIVRRHDGGQVVSLRLGNGVVVMARAEQLEAVEYMPGSGCPCSFVEEMHRGS
jgi:hypothetical protein